MTYAIFLPDELEFVDRGDGSGRTLIGISDDLTQTRAKFWRYPPGTRGKRHAEHVQEEVFVVLEGTLTMLLGEPPERVDLPPQSVVNVEVDTPLQLFNAGNEEVAVFIYGAPPETDQSEMLEDLTL